MMRNGFSRDYMDRNEKAVSPRRAAYLSLVRCAEGQKYANLELDAAIRKYGFSGEDRAFFTRLLYGVIEKAVTLDYLIGRFSSTPIGKIEPKVLHLLRLGLYQILYMDRVPDSAAVNETVELSKTELHKGASGFVNALLRRAVREKNALPAPKAGTLASLSVAYSIPEPLCAFFADQYGYEKASSVLAALNRPAPLSLRVNTLKTTPEALLSALLSKGCAAETSPLVPDMLLLPGGAVSEMDELSDGSCFVQDTASRLCTVALDARPGMKLLDTCACPGGKTFSAAIDMKNDGSVLALDLHESKLSLVKSGAERLGITIVETGVQDGSKENEAYFGAFDRVLCDVPCSGLGVIAKKPDLRHKDPEAFSRLPAIQSRILENGAKYLKAGGILVYSTCTLNRAENEEVVSAFLASHPDFSLCGEKMPKGEGIQTLLPDEWGTDGFFFAKMQKSPSAE